MSQLWSEQKKDQHKRFFFLKKKKSPSVVVKILHKKFKILLKIELFVAVKRCSRVAGNKAAEWMASHVCACTLPAPPRRRQPGPAVLRTPSGPLCLPYQPESKAHNPTVYLPPTEPLSILPRKMFSLQRRRSLLAVLPPSLSGCQITLSVGDQ